MDTEYPQPDDHGELPDRLNCPVCRANQEPSLECRRCGADLNLVLWCLSSRRQAERKREAAIESGDLSTAHRMEEYLTWLVGRPS